MMGRKWFSKFCLKKSFSWTLLSNSRNIVVEWVSHPPPSPNYCQQHYIFIFLAHINKELNPKIIHVNFIMSCLLWVSYYRNLFYGSRLVCQAHWTSWNYCPSNFCFNWQSQLSDSWCCHFMYFKNSLQFPMFSSTLVCNNVFFDIENRVVPILAYFQPWQLNVAILNLGGFDFLTLQLFQIIYSMSRWSC
jgi:hypothetical protein